ncbi:MAG: IS200/IS605 family transposase [Rhodobacter sp.]|nr:IS200/IS605 family transposase [Rhodobacter sp.]
MLPGDHVQMFVSVPPKLAISDLMHGMKGRSPHRVQRGFPEIRRRCRGRRFWGRGYFPATTGAITDGPALQYVDSHLPDATGASR